MHLHQSLMSRKAWIDSLMTRLSGNEGVGTTLRAWFEVRGPQGR